MVDNVICPFSKPIIGNWCQCEFAKLEERCSGKMGCKGGTKHLDECYQLVEMIKDNSQFVLGLSDKNQELTHAQSMKIRCGGLLGMQRFLGFEDAVADIPWIISEIHQRYSSFESFPYNEIMPDITHFSHRKGRSR